MDNLITKFEYPQLLDLVQNSWILQTGVPGAWERLSEIPSDEELIKEFIVEAKPESLNKIFEAAKERLLTQKKFLVSAGAGEQDFAPAAFLQIGSSRSLPVCRIARYFPLKDFQEFIKSIEQTIQKRKDDTYFNTIEKLQEIFLLPDEIASEIFSLIHATADQASESFLQGSELLKTLRTNISEHQLSKINPIPLGTGFLVGNAHLLTNCHVIQSKVIASQCVAQFNYIDDELGAIQKSVDYEFEPDLLFASEAKLDYTLVQLKPEIAQRQAGYQFGWLQLIEDEACILPRLTSEEVMQLNNDRQLKLRKYELSDGNNQGDNVFIIHHPKGKQKKIDVANNRVVEGGLFKDFLRYRVKSDFGSSGSPIFNVKWELVALHHAAIPKDPLSQNWDIVAQQGIRTCRIIQDLKQKSFADARLASFIRDFVITAEQRNYTPFATALKFDGINNYIDAGKIGTEKSQAFSFEAWVSPQPLKSDITLFTKFYTEDWADSSSVLGNYVLSLRITKTGDVILARTMSLNSYPAVSLLYPQQCSALFYPKVYPSLLLQLDSSGTAVHLFKQFFNIVIDGLDDLQDKAPINDDVFDKSTVKAVTIFQTGRFDKDGKALMRDGKVGPQTLSALWKVLRLKNGDQGLGVRLLQTALSCDSVGKKELLDHLKAANGQFDDETEKAVKLFQGGRVPVETGVADNSTLDALWQFGLILRHGNCGQGVTDLQNLLLHRLNCTDVSPSGVFEETQQPNEPIFGKTTQAVKKFQRENYLPADGLVGALTLQAFKRANSCEIQTKSKDALPRNIFSHIALTCDNNSLQLYINGKPISFDTPSTIYQASGKEIGRLANNEMQFLIGAYSEVSDRISSTLSKYFRGAISELRIWTTKRNESEILANLNCRMNTDEVGLVGYWRFEEGKNKSNGEAPQNTVQQIFNIAPNGRATQVSQNQEWSLLSHFPNLPLPCGLRFNDEESRIEITGLKFNKENKLPEGITIEAWIKYGFGDGVIISYGVDQTNNSYALSWKENRVRVTLQGETVETRLEVCTLENAPADKMWHHVAFTWGKTFEESNTSKEVELYIDGRRQDCIVIKGQAHALLLQGQYKTIGIFEGFDALMAEPLKIGSGQDKQTAKEAQSGAQQAPSYFDFVIADVRLWNVCRPQDQIKANMSQRLNSDVEKDNGLIGYWRLDEGSDDRVINLVSKTPATIHGAKWFPMPARSEQTATAQPS